MSYTTRLAQERSICSQDPVVTHVNQDFCSASEDISVLNTEMAIGENDEDVFCRLDYMKICPIDLGGSKSIKMVYPLDYPLEGERVLCLGTIAVPKSRRNKGICGNILTTLENRSVTEGIGFVVGPLMDYGQEVLLPGILKRRGYRRLGHICMEYVGCS